LQPAIFFCSESSTGFPRVLDARAATPAAVARRAELVSDPLRVKQASLDGKNSLLASKSCGLFDCPWSKYTGRDAST